MLILALDIDGTIQGDISPQVEEYTLMKQVGLKYNTKLLFEDYNKGLLRPYFVDFIRAIKQKNLPVELYIYTASEPSWAQTIVPVIEKIVDYRFNRPIFTRAHCDMTKSKHKSLDLIATPILRSLKKKHKGYNFDVEAIKKMTLLIDNNFILQQEDRLIKCPTYERTIQLDPLRQLDSSSTIKYKHIIAAVILEKLYTKESIWYLLEEVYGKVKMRSKRHHKSNKKSRNDQFWKAISWIFMKGENCSDIASRLVFHFQGKNNQ